MGKPLGPSRNLGVSAGPFSDLLGSHVRSFRATAWDPSSCSSLDSTGSELVYLLLYEQVLLNNGLLQ